MAWRGLEGTHLHWDGFLSCDSFKTERGTINAVPSLSKDIVNKEYVDDKLVESFPTALTAGSVVFSDGTNLTEDNFNLFWDSATHELQPHHMKIVSDGSQASPALKFNDTNTGFYKSGDSVRLSINNSTKMTIDDVEGAEFTGAITINNIVPIFYLEDSNGTATHSVTSLQVNNSNFNIQTRDSDKVFVAQNYKIIQGASGATDHQWFINGVKKMVIASNGDVGIGIDVPTGTLDVAEATLGRVVIRTTTEEVGDIAALQFSTGLGLSDTTISADILAFVTQADPDALKGELAFRTNKGDVVTERLRIESDGNIIFKGGDTYWTGDGSGLPYGSCYGNDIAWTQVAAINVVYNVSDADMVTGQLNLATHDGSGKLTVTKAGRYKCDYTATIKSSIAGKHIISGFEVSGSGNMEPAGRNHIDLVGANNQLECSGNAILDLAANATIEMAISSSDAGNPTVTVEHLNITLFQIGGT